MNDFKDCFKAFFSKQEGGGICFHMIPCLMKFVDYLMKRILGISSKFRCAQMIFVASKNSGPRAKTLQKISSLPNLLRKTP